MKLAVSAIAILAVITAGTVYAQQPPVEQPPVIAPAPEPQPAPAPEPQPAPAPQPEPAPAPLPEPAPAPAPEAPAISPAPMAPEMPLVVSVDGYIASQAANQLLASDLMGRPVYNNADETLGVVNNILFTEDGQIVGLVVGVGGFLGIGQKNVAIAYSEVSIRTDENGVARLFFDRTLDVFADAPSFETLAMQNP